MQTPLSIKFHAVMWRALWLFSVLILVSCGHARMPSDEGLKQAPEIFDDHVIADDGYRLPLYRWESDVAPQVVVLALHGFGDYGGSFAASSGAFTNEGVVLYAYDQRGFGLTEHAGVWAGEARMAADVHIVAHLLRRKYPDLPLYLIGKSMGGAVAISALTNGRPPPVDGAVLIAPAVWGRTTMPWYQRTALRIVNTMAPGLQLTGKMTRRVGVRVTDDPEVSRALSLDPLVQKQFRVDMINGLTNLMSSALENAGHIQVPALILYGSKDEVIPAGAFCALLDRLPNSDASSVRMALYPEGFHMLTRYSQGAMTQHDMSAWVRNPGGMLPSGHEVGRAMARTTTCERGASLAQSSETLHQHN